MLQDIFFLRCSTCFSILQYIFRRCITYFFDVAVHIFRCCSIYFSMLQCMFSTLHFFVILQYFIPDVALHSFFICLQCCTWSVSYSFGIRARWGNGVRWGTEDKGEFRSIRAGALDVRALELELSFVYCPFFEFWFELMRLQSELATFYTNLKSDNHHYG